MKRKRFSEEQIIEIVKAHAAGAKAADVCRQHGISESTLYAWKAKFGGMEVSDARRLKVMCTPLIPRVEPESVPHLSQDSSVMQRGGAQNDQSEQQSECNSGNHEEIDRSYAVGVVSQECLPRL